MVLNMTLYVSSKSGIWQCRFQIPTRYRVLFNGRHEVKKSLKTTNKKKAKVLSLEIELDIRKKMDTMEETAVPFEQVVAAVLQTRFMRLDETYRAIVNPLSDEAYYAHIDIVNSAIEDYSDLDSIVEYVGLEQRTLLLDTIFPADCSVEQCTYNYMQTVVSKNPYIDLSPNSPEFWQLVQSLNTVNVMAKRIKEALEDYNHPLAELKHNELKQFIESITPSFSQTQVIETPTVTQTKSNTNRGIKFSKAIGLFIESKTGDGLRAKSLQGYSDKLSVICDLLGDPYVNEVERVVAESLRGTLLQYPTNKNKGTQFRGLGWKACIEKAKHLGHQTLSHSSVKGYIEKCSTFYSWLNLHNHCTRNPFKSIKVNNGTGRVNKYVDARQRYTEDDLAKIFTTEIFTQKKFIHNYYYWLPIIGLLTGARIDEICQLYVDNIKQTKDGLWYFEFTDEREDQKLKTGSSERAIPIHSKLIDLGFLRYVSTLDSNGRVFPELKKSRDGYSQASSKWFGRFKTRLGFNKKYVFHSFRHTVADELKQKKADPYLAGGLEGHIAGTITYDRYGKTYRPETLIDIMKLLDFKCLDNVQAW